jgi:hypothetical protein
MIEHVGGITENPSALQCVTTGYASYHQFWSRFGSDADRTIKGSGEMRWEIFRAYLVKGVGCSCRTS